MAWNPHQKQQFRDELQAVYLDYMALRIFVQDAVGWSLPTIVGSEVGLQKAAFLLIEEAEAKGKLDPLWQAFATENPHRQIVQIGLSQGSCPFFYGGPIAPDGFYGRSQLIREVRGRIGGSSPQCVNLVGMRRAGKSSLLRLIEESSERFFTEGCKPLIVSLDLTNSCFHSPAGIQEKLRREIGVRMGRSPWPENLGDDPFAFEDGLREVRDRGWRLVVLLDEFEGISQHLEAFQGWGEDWRTKASAGLLTLVVVGQRPIGEI